MSATHRQFPLRLRSAEMDVVEALCAEQDLSKTALIRQALRLYQLVHERLKAGETMSFSGDKERVALFIGVGFGVQRAIPSQTASQGEKKP